MTFFLMRKEFLMDAPSQKSKLITDGRDWFSVPQGRHIKQSQRSSERNHQQITGNAYQNLLEWKLFEKDCY